MDEHEVRVTKDNTELRAVDGPQGPQITGYAAVFNSESEDLGGFRETIEAGAFRNSIVTGADVRALVNHDPSQVLGRSKAGTLRLAEDQHGLRYEIDLPDTTAARDVRESIKRGDISGSSFAFTVPEGGDRWEGNSRTLTKVELFDVGPVTFPAYPATVTEASMRSLQMAKRGTSLSSLLEDLIEADDRPRADVVASMASAAGIDVGTVNSIIAGGIDCPPLNRLSGMASALGTTVGRLRTAAEKDGCSYSGRTRGQVGLTGEPISATEALRSWAKRGRR
jgi:HK97 family phage prohead protease